MKPWYWRSLPLENRTGSQVFAALFLTNSSTIATLLESPNSPSKHQQLTRYSICAGAPRNINGIAQAWTPRLGEVLPFLNQRWQIAGENTAPDLPFTGGWLGWLGYDVAWEIEKLPYDKPDALPFPVAFWYEPACFAVLDHWEQIVYLAATEFEELDDLEQQIAQSPEKKASTSSTLHSAFVPHFCTSQSEYETMICRAKKYIQSGDIFQANLSLRFETQTTASGWEIYQALQQINPSPFASYWRSPWGEIVSCSPERLVQLVGKTATTRPIAGTRSRGTTHQQDQQLASDLLANTKERAEHIMLVDLERNDLGRVCTWGSVSVDELLTIERYSHVMHLVSNVRGTLSSNYNAVDLIRAMFPGGTITGCPKVRCMEIIEELEPVRRNLFYGSCGYIDRRGNVDLNILIRTLLRARPAANAPAAKIWGQVGAGIVADSDPEREWYESLHKAQAQLAALERTRGKG